MHPIAPGLLILQGNRLELLREAVFEWTGRNPLAPLEEEIFLVQSNGIAEWLKMALATSRGICAATRVELPARFLWRSYRQTLGPNDVPARSAMDKTALTWRLLQLLPAQLERPEFLPLKRFLAAGDWERRLQLAQRLADLFDQYQVYRADWLAAWSTGADGLPGPAALKALPADQRWQPLLWRELIAAFGDEAQLSSRPELHRRFLKALLDDANPVRPVARRVILFGLSTVPQQTLEALAALSRRCQVLLAIPNPCRYHWADIIDGRELLSASRRRHAYRGGRDLSGLSLEDMHAPANPLLAAWGRQGRDFVRQLDQHEDALSVGGTSATLPVDLFDTDEGDTLLAQAQARIRDLVPLGEPDTAPRRRSDRSIVFHIAHSAQREVEILHDQLLALLADPPGGALAPRDIVVMMPDVETFAPAVRAVFGQYTRHDARYIPFNLADLRQRTTHPLLVALEWLLRLPHQRCGLSELQSLFEVPAVAARFGVDPAEQPLLNRWMAGTGIRWGVHARQRAEMGLAACGEQNSWLFGLQRMLLGFASGDNEDFAGIEPYGEIGGLEASLIGSLAALVAAVMRWTELAGTLATAPVWGERLTELLSAFFAATDEAEQAAIASLLDAQRDWLEASAAADFEEAIPLSVVREAWLSGVDEPSLAQRFLSGGVTFCTLLPMRAAPFEVVCLLGMNDGDYPRQSQRSDFDLMGLPRERRPGDRSRRDDDRYLMLEALLSARQVLYVSWTGRSVRDNSAQPPSVLVAQLRDYLSAGWGRDVVESLTTEHPLQPFSRRYFEPYGAVPGGALVTYAREWREAHADEVAPGTGPDTAGELGTDPPPTDLVGSVSTTSDGPALTVLQLTRFLKNPVKAFFRQRLNVVFDELPDPVEDDESFAVDSLETWGLIDALVTQATAQGEPEAALAAQTQRLVRAGQLPMGELGSRAGDELLQATQPMLRQWQSLCATHSRPISPQPLRCDFAGGAFDDWLDGLRSTPSASAPAIHLSLTASKLTNKSGLRPEALVEAWVRALAAAVCEQGVTTTVVGRDAAVNLPPLELDAARPAWDALLQAWEAGMAAPLPVPSATAIAYLLDPGSVQDVYHGSDFRRGEREEACLARTYPDVDALLADGRLAQWAPRLFEPLLHWVASAQVAEHPQQAAKTQEPAHV